MRGIPYINEEVASRDFKYYIFDWDDNILHMPTKIKLEHLGDNQYSWGDFLISHNESKAYVKNLVIKDIVLLICNDV